MRGRWLQGLRQATRGGQMARALAVLLVAAFVLQSALAKSHFHFGDALASGNAVVVAKSDGAVVAPESGKAPRHDESNCPLWHASAVCGGALAVVVAGLIGPAFSIYVAPLDERVVAPERYATVWRSRAPPIL